MYDGWLGSECATETCSQQLGQESAPGSRLTMLRKQDRRQSHGEAVGHVVVSADPDCDEHAMVDGITHQVAADVDVYGGAVVDAELNGLEDAER